MLIIMSISELNYKQSQASHVTTKLGNSLAEVFRVAQLPLVLDVIVSSAYPDSQSNNHYL